MNFSQVWIFIYELAYHDKYCHCPLATGRKLNINDTGQKMKFSIKDFSSKCDQIRRKPFFVQWKVKANSPIFIKRLTNEIQIKSIAKCKTKIFTIMLAFSILYPILDSTKLLIVSFFVWYIKACLFLIHHPEAVV